MLGMSSACSNPVLYGWLNDNFRKEFVEIFGFFSSCRKVNVVHSLDKRKNEVRMNIITQNKNSFKSAESIDFSDKGDITDGDCSADDFICVRNEIPNSISKTTIVKF